MSEFQVLKQTTLGSQHEPTGKTRHYLGVSEVPPAVSLKIIKYTDVEGFYLLHFDINGEELADTFHETMEDALSQAEWEYQVKPHEWT